MSLSTYIFQQRGKEKINGPASQPVQVRIAYSAERMVMLLPLHKGRHRSHEGGDKQMQLHLDRYSVSNQYIFPYFPSHALEHTA